MSTSHNDSTSRPGAIPVGEQSHRRKWLLPLLLGLLALIALLFLLSRCGDDDTPAPAGGGAPSPFAVPTTAASVPGAGPASSGPSGAGQTDTGAAGEPGAVTAGGANLLGTAGAANLRANNGQQAVGRAVKVQSVPADEGFWVGASEQDRLWVQLTGTRGESDYKVKPGDTIDFTGTVTPVEQGFAARTGVTEAEGADQLTEQGHYLSVPKSSVALSR